MKILVKAVVTGFGLAIGSALFKKVSKYVGLDEKAAPTINQADGATDPNLRTDQQHHQYS